MTHTVFTIYGREAQRMLYNDNNLTLPQMVYRNKCKINELVEKIAELTPKSFTFTIPNQNWVEKGSYYEVSISDLETTDNDCLILLPDTGVSDDVKIYYMREFSKINELTKSNGSIVLRCYNGKPTVDLIINIIKFYFEEAV